MPKLIYTCITSLDGYVADEDGSFDWSAPDDEVHAFVNDLERGLGTFLYGRRLYDVMVAWETMSLDETSPVMADYATIWRAADKVVYSTTLDRPASARTRIERSFDPESIERMKQTATSDLGIGGPTLAAHALRAGLVDEICMVVSPVIVGGGTPMLPDRLRLSLELLDERRFGNGVVFLRYACRPV